MKRPGVLKPNIKPRARKKGYKGLGFIPGPNIPFVQVGLNPHDKKFASLTASPYILAGRFPLYD